MVILHTFLALLGGFGVMALAVALMTALLQKLTPEWCGHTPVPGEVHRPAASYLFVNLGYSFLAAALGGYTTAWLAPANPLVHVLVLAIIVLALSALSAIQFRGKQPVGYAPSASSPAASSASASSASYRTCS